MNRTLVVALTAAFSLTACAGGTMQPPLQASGPSQVTRHRPATAGSPDGTIYIFNGSPNSGVDIVRYASGNYAPPPASTLSNLPGASGDMKGGMTFDGKGNLWTSYLAAGPTEYFGITEYSSPSTSPTLVKSIVPGNAVHAGAFGGIAVDASGNVWVSDPSGSVYEYASNARGVSLPIQTIASYSLVGAGKLGIDSLGNLWVASASGLFEYAVTASSATLLNSLYTAGSGGTANKCFDGYVSSITSFTFDPSGNVLVGTNVTGTTPNVLEWVPSFDKKGGEEFPDCPTFYGTVQTQTAAGALYGIPHDLSTDDQGYVYVIYGNTPDALVFAESNVTDCSMSARTPYAWIQGSNSGMSDPTGIAVWANSGWLNGNVRKRTDHDHCKKLK